MTETRRDGIRIILGLLAAMWLLEIADAALNANLDQYGIEPRDTDGLPGIVAAPFLHGGFGHLIGNTIPFLVLGVLIAFQGAMRVIWVTLIVGLVAGLGTWVTGPENSIHIGASGIVFGYATYLLTRGVFNSDIWEILIGVGVAAVWGTALLGGLVPQEGVSWQGHFFGAVGGVVAAWVFRRERPAAPAAA